MIIFPPTNYANMGLTQRIIPRLDLKDRMTIMYVNFEDLCAVGNSIEHALICNEHEIVTFNGSQPINMGPITWAQGACSVAVQAKFSRSL